MEKNTAEIGMTLDEVIKRRSREDNKTGKTIRKIMNQRNRRFRRRNNYTSSSSKDTRRRIRVENLNKEFQNSDLTQLFQEYGKLTRCGIKFDKMGVSTGIADIEFSTHEECEKAINTLDNAEIKGEKLRVKYASSVRNPRRTRSAGVQRRNIRRINRVRRRGRPRSTRRLGRRGARTGASSTRKSLGGSRRRVFARTLGRRRAQKK